MSTTASLRGTRRVRRAALATGVCLAAVCATAVALVTPGYPPTEVVLGTGQAWLGSTAVSQVALVSGITGEVVQRVRLPLDTDGLAVAQVGHHAVVAGVRSGRTVRVDAATAQVEPDDSRPLPEGSGTVRVVAGGAAGTHVLASGGRHVMVDDTTLEPLAEVADAAREVDVSSAVVDVRSVVWALDTGGGLVRFTPGEDAWTRPSVATPGEARLAVVGGDAVLVDPRSDDVAWLTADGELRRAACRPGDAVAPIAAAGTSSGQVLVASGTTGALTVADVGSGACGVGVRLADPGTSFGTPVEAAGTVFVPNRSSGVVHVVDLDDLSVVDSPQAVDGDPSGLELVAWDGIVFYNDPSTGSAGVILPSAAVTPIEKYSAGNPDAGVDEGAGARQAPAVAESGTPAPQAEVTLRLSMSPAVAGRQTDLRVAALDGTTLTAADWSFGDDTPTVEGPVAVTHRWERPGTYRVNVSATTDAGQTLFAAADVEVAPPEEVVEEEPTEEPPPDTDTGDTTDDETGDDDTTDDGTTDDGTGDDGTGDDGTGDDGTGDDGTGDDGQVDDVTLTLTVEGAGTVTASPPPPDDPAQCSQTCELRYAKGTEVRLTAEDREAIGEVFVGFSQPCQHGDDVGDALLTCTVTLDEPEEVTGTYELRPRVVLDVPTRTGPAPLTVSVGAGGSVGFTAPLTYVFDWGEQEPTTTASPTESHTYQTPGTYTLRVTVHGTGGATDDETVTIVVGACQPRVTALDAPTEVDVGQLVTLTAHAVCAEKFLWTRTGPGGSFGSGNDTSELGFAAQIEGTYTVSVTPVGHPNHGLSTTINAVDRAAVVVVAVSGCPTFSEGDSGTSTGGNTFAIVLSRASSDTVAVQYGVAQTATGGATAGEDFVAATGSVVFQPGTVTRPVTVDIIGDTVPEPNEAFDLTLSNPQNATLGRASCYGVIIDPEDGP